MCLLTLRAILFNSCRHSSFSRHRYPHLQTLSLILIVILFLHFLVSLLILSSWPTPRDLATAAAAADAAGQLVQKQQWVAPDDRGQGHRQLLQLLGGGAQKISLQLVIRARNKDTQTSTVLRRMISY